MSKSDKENGKKPYDFGGVEEYSLEDIEKEILEETVYLDVFAGSDSRFKLNVKKLENSLNKIEELDAVTYDYDTEKFQDKNFPKSEQVGFIAQAVKSVVPQAVKEDEEGYHYVNYSALVPVLTEGIKELKAIVEKQNDKIIELEKRLANSENFTSKSEISSDDVARKEELS